MSSLLIHNALLLLIFMTLAYGVARARRRLDTVDTAWGLGFVLAAWAVEIVQASGRSLLIALLVSVWGLRLSSHIWRRSIRRGEDPRYIELSRKWRGSIWRRAYVSVFLLQGALIWVISLPIVLAANKPLVGWGWLTLLGALMWLAGFTFEAISDHQLAVFLSRQNRPKVLQTGLWRYSRHPNYFGELTQWWGIGLIALQTSYGWLGFIGPLTLSLLIVFISGIPPIEKRRQKDPEYRQYQNQTSVLIPIPRRRQGV